MTGKNKARFWVYGIAILIAVLSVIMFSNSVDKPIEQIAPTEKVQAEPEITEIQPTDIISPLGPSLENAATENVASEIKEDVRQEIVEEIESGIFLVNTPGEPAWDEEWERIVKETLSNVRVELKTIISANQPLLITLDDTIPIFDAYYSVDKNTIVLDRGFELIFDFGGFISKNDMLYFMILHEVGHALDANFKGDPRVENLVSQNEWRELVEKNPRLKAWVKLRRADPATGLNSLMESFADGFAMYFKGGVSDIIFSQFDKETKDLLLSWFEEQIIGASNGE